MGLPKTSEKELAREHLDTFTAWAPAAAKSFSRRVVPMCDYAAQDRRVHPFMVALWRGGGLFIIAQTPTSLHTKPRPPHSQFVPCFVGTTCCSGIGGATCVPRSAQIFSASVPTWQVVAFDIC